MAHMTGAINSSRRIVISFHITDTIIANISFFKVILAFTQVLPNYPE